MTWPLSLLLGDEAVDLRLHQLLHHGRHQGVQLPLHRGTVTVSARYRAGSKIAYIFGRPDDMLRRHIGHWDKEVRGDPGKSNTGIEVQ